MGSQKEKYLTAGVKRREQETRYRIHHQSTRNVLSIPGQDKLEP